MSWRRLPGKDVADIDVVSTSKIWAITKSEKIYSWTGTKWALQPGRLTSIACGSAGVWGVTKKGQIYKWATNTWSRVRGSVSSLAVGSTVWGIYKGAPYQWEDNAWVRRPGSKIMAISAGEDGEVWALHASHQVYRWSGTTWAVQPGKFNAIAVASKEYIVALDSKGRLMKRQHGNWVVLDSEREFTRFAVCPNHIFGIDAAGFLWTLADVPQVEGWKEMFQGVRQLSIADVDDVWAVTTDHDVYHYEVDKQKWTQVAGVKLLHISASSDQVWGVDLNKHPMRYNGESWERQPGRVRRVSVGGTEVWAVGEHGVVYRWDQRGNWEAQPTGLARISIGRDGTLWAVNSADMVFKYVGGAWRLMPGALRDVSVGRDGLVLGINKSATLLQWSDNTQTWAEKPNPFALTDVEIYSEKHWWGVNGEGECFRYHMDGGEDEEDEAAAAAAAAKQEAVDTGKAVKLDWHELEGQWKHFVCAAPADFWGVAADNSVRRFKNGAWSEIPGKMRAVSAYQGNVWGVSTSGDVFEWDGRRWLPRPGGVQQVAVAGLHVWGVNKAGQVFRWTGSKWEQKPGRVARVSVGYDGDVWAVSKTGSVYRWVQTRWVRTSGKLQCVSLGTAVSAYGVSPSLEMYKFDGLKWGAVPNPQKLVHISVYNNHHIVGIDAAGKAWRGDSAGGEAEDVQALLAEELTIEDAMMDAADMSLWKQVPGKLLQLDASGDNVWGVTPKTYKVFRYEESGWKQVAGRLRFVSVGYDGECWGLAPDGRVYRRIEENNTWQLIDVQLAHLSVGSKVAVWGLDSNGSVYRWNALTFDRVPAAKTLRWISVGEDGDCWGVDLTRRPVHWDGEKFVRTQFDPDGNVVTIAAASTSVVWCMTTRGIFRRNAETGEWFRVNGALRTLCCTQTHVWGVGRNNMVFRLGLNDAATSSKLQASETAQYDARLKQMEQQLKQVQGLLATTASSYEARVAALSEQLHNATQKVEKEHAEFLRQSAVLEAQEAEMAAKEESIKRMTAELERKTQGHVLTEEEREDKIKEWTVEVVTGNLRGAGSDANVSVVLRGKNGETPPTVLDNDAYNFRRNRTDKFVVKTDKDIGPLQSISIGIDNTGFSPAWYLERVSVRNYLDDQWHFKAAQWLDEDNGMQLDLTPIEGELVLPKVMLYRLEVLTGDRPGAGTDAKVSITLEGENGKQSVEIDDKEGLERSSSTVVGIECLDLGALKRIIVGHNNKGFRPGWFLDKIRVLNTTTGKQNFFLCGDWLASDESDGKLIRELEAREQDAVCTLPMHNYTITVITGDRRGAGTDADVDLVLYGTKSKSRNIRLESSANDFERGKTGIFGCSVPDIGDIQKVRIGHNNKGIGAGWFLDKVLVRNESTGKETFHLCGRWLATSEDDGAITRELVASDKDGVACLPLVSYKVTVVTGERRGAGTDATVSVVLFGENGDSGSHVLDSKANDFERGSTCEFGLEAVDLGELRSLRIGHDDSGFGSGWFLERVEVQNTASGIIYHFPCHKWMDKGEEDGRIVRDIPAHLEAGPEPPALLTYRVSTYTGDRRGAATAADVYAVVYGENGDSGRIVLENDRRNFSRGRIDTFQFQAVDLGQLSRLEIGHNNKGVGSGWFLDKAEVLAGNGQKWTFGCQEWLDGTGSVKDLAPVPEDYSVTGQCTYQVTVITADRRGAGTNANIQCTLFGAEGAHSYPTALDNAQDNFERNKTDVFEVVCDDLGALSKIILESDGAGIASAWFVDRVEVYAEALNQTFYFNVADWIPNASGSLTREVPAADSAGAALLPLVQYKVVLVTGDRPGAGTDANVWIEVFGANGQTARLTVDTPGNSFERGDEDEWGFEAVQLGKLEKIRIGHDDTGVGSAWLLDKVVVTDQLTGETFYFLAGCWLSNETTLSKEVAASNADGVGCAPATYYHVKVYTADRRGAGTDARVELQVFGAEGESQLMLLDNSQNNFERGSIDEFAFEAVNLGELQKILIRHDNSGTAPGWLLDRVVIEAELGNALWVFPCGQWLAHDEGDGKTARELTPHADDISALPPLNWYTITVRTADVRAASTSARVTCTLFGDKGDTAPFALEAPHGMFARGTDVTFKKDFGDLGVLQKLRVGHDDSGIGAGWKLDKVIVRDETTQKDYFFLCGKWLARDEEDQRIERELVATSEDGVTYAPETVYTARVLTGDRRGAGTNANVYMRIVGTLGESAELHLDKKGAFRRRQLDVFSFPIVSIGTPKHIYVWHDGKGVADGWFLDKIILKSEELGREWYFLAGRWLATDEADHKLEVVLQPQDEDGQSCLPLVLYEVTVETSNIRGAGTDASVFITLTGDSGDSGERLLDNDLNNFERGRRDVFQIECVDLGPLKRARVRTDNRGAASAWHLGKVVVKDMRRNQLNYFVCNDWVSSKNGLTKELGCSLEDTEVHVALKTYTIKTLTSDLAGAGTDARVVLSLTGENGTSSEHVLDAPGNTFERGNEDTFQIKDMDLGALKKIRIGHTSTAKGSGWHLSKVIVIAEGADASEQGGPANDNNAAAAAAPLYAVCNRWLAVDEDDGQTVRELGLSTEDKPVKMPWLHYKLRVFTADRSGAGTNAKIWATFVGANGESGKRLLDGPHDAFYRGKVSEFEFELLDLGPLTKLRIESDGRGVGSAWLLDKVEVAAGDGKTYFFNSGQWFDAELEDGKLLREIPAEAEGKRNYLPEVRYRITVVTGDRFGAGTDSDIYVQLYGANGDKSDVTLLDNRKNNFERRRTDQFELIAPDLGDLLKLRVENVARGTAASAWFLDQIVVHSEGTGKDYYFKYGQWLPKEETKERQAEIAASDEGGQTYLPMVTYQLDVVTGDRFGAGTNADIYATIFGSNGDSGRVLLDTKGDNFKRKGTDVFHITAVDLGEVKFLRLENENNHPAAGWFCEKAVLSNPKDGSKRFFLCGKWLADDEEDAALSRDLPASNEDGSPCLPMQTYTLEVVTGDRRGASTNAQVYVQLFGDNGDSGPRPLSASRDPFQRNKTDFFAFEAVDLGALKRLKVWHDDGKPGAGWFLDQITVRCGDGSQYVFGCGRWLAKDEDDGAISRDLAPGKEGPFYSPLSRYNITVITGDRHGAGTDGDVFVQLFGAEGSSSDVFLDSEQNNFERRKTDVFSTEVVSLGALSKVRVRLVPKGAGSAWFLEKIVVRDEKSKQERYFLLGDWITKKNPIQEIAAADKDGQPALPLKQYKVIINTGDRMGAGTNSSVYLTLSGGNGDSGRRLLDDRRDNFERGRPDEFVIEAVDLGAINKCRLELESHGAAPAWFCEKVVVLDTTTNVNSYFLVGKWLDDKQNMLEVAAQAEDGKACDPEVIYQVEVWTADRRGAGTDSVVKLLIEGEKGNTGDRELDGSFERGEQDAFELRAVDLGLIKKIRIGHDNTGIGSGWFLDRVKVRDTHTGKEYYFPAGRWLDEKEGDGKIVVELVPSNEAGSPLHPLVTYKVSVLTADRRGAGTDANVHIVLTGDKGSSGKLPLDAPRSSFERGETSEFGVDCEDLGLLQKIRIGHDNSGFAAGWFLDKVWVQNVQTGEIWYFLAGRWLAADEGDGQIVVDVPASMNDGLAVPPLVTYRVTVETGDRHGAGTNADVFVTIYGDKGDTGQRTLEAKDAFKRNAIDTFGVEAVDVGSLKKIRIGHNDRGFFRSAAWFLNKVTVENTATAERWYFMAGRWLDKRTGDNEIVVELPAQDHDGVACLPITRYSVQLHTGDVKGAGTRSNIVCTLFGEHGDSGAQDLDAGHIQRGSVEDFDFEVVDLGALARLQIGHDNTGYKAAWYLDHAVVRNLKTGEEWRFDANAWFDDDSGDKKLVRDLYPAAGAAARKNAPLTRYQLSLKTGDLRQAGTSANVFLTVYGTLGSSQKLKLENSSLFSRGATCTIEQDIPDLGELLKVRVGHDNSNPLTANWYCEWVKVKSLRTDDEWEFPCNQWFDKLWGDRRVVRELEVSKK